MTLLLLAALPTLALLLWFVRLERSGRPLTAVLFILGVLVVESVLYPAPFDVPPGLFHPGSAALSFRLYDVLIPLALLARLIGRGLPHRFGTAMLWWISFFAWLAAAAVTGAAQGYRLDLVTFEAKAVIYLGALALTAGIPWRHYLESRGLQVLILASGAVAAVLVVTNSAHLRVPASLPGVPGMVLGELGSDTASLFVALGLLGLSIAACRSDRRLGLVLAAGPLLLSALLAGQRAALTGLVVSMLILVVGWALPAARRHLRTTATEFALAFMVMAALVTVPIIKGAFDGRAEASVLPFVNSVEKVLDSRGKQLSAEGRINQWTKARGIIVRRPWFGWGLGKTYVYYEPGPALFYRSNLTHNIAADLLLRTGFVGLFLFGVSIGLSLRDGVRVWRSHPHPEAAGLALGCVAVVSGLLVKGMVESLFEKYRLATLIGLLVGTMRGLATSATESSR